MRMKEISRRTLFPFLFGLTAFCLPAAGLAEDAAPAPTGGVVHGRIAYQADAARPWRYARYYIKDRKAGLLAETVVALRPVDRKKKFPRTDKPKTAVMDQKDFRFVPETLAIRAGDPVKFLNSDPHVHNVRTTDDVVPFNVNMPSGSQHEHTFLRAGGTRAPLRIGCTFHSTMKAWIFVFNTPWFQVTKDDGAFSLKNIEPGEYWLDVVHPAGELAFSKQIAVEAGQSQNIDIELSPDNLTEKKP